MESQKAKFSEKVQNYHNKAALSWEFDFLIH